VDKHPGMRHLIFSVFVVLGGCNTPGPHFRGLEPTRISVDGSVFDIRVRGELAEALRVNPEYAPRLGPIQTRAAQAMALVSGCIVTEVRGDQALLTGLLDCDGSGRKRMPFPDGSGEFDCVRVDRGSQPPYEDFECDPI
jgi:hypothetical protein